MPASRLPAALRRSAADLRTALAAAPVEAALAVGLAVALSVSMRTPGFTGGEFRRLAASVALAFPLVFGFSYLRARGAVSAPVRSVGTAASLALAAWLGLAWLHDGRAADWWRWALLAAAAALVLLLAPLVPWRRRDRRETWAFAARLVARTVAVGIYAGVLYLLLLGAVAAVVSLFELRQPRYLYADLAGAVFFALAPLLLIGGVHRLAAPAEPGIPPAVALLGRWLYAPSLVLYLLILYAYGLKVAVTGELPRNLLSPLVIAAGAIGLLGGYLLLPVHEGGERVLSLLVRAFPLALLPLVPLALWGLAARLGEYGWTEFRFARLAVVLALLVLAAWGTVRLLRSAPPLHAAVPAVLAGVLVLSAVGPWSAPAVSRRDQIARLRAALAEAGVDPARLPADSVTVDSAAYARIDAAAGYLARAHGFGPVRDVVPAFRGRAEDRWSMGLALGLKRSCAPGEWQPATIDWRTPVPGVVAGSVQDVAVPEEGGRSPAGARLRIEGADLVAEGEGWRARGALPAPFSAEDDCETRFRAPHSRLSGPAARVDLRDGSGRVRAQFVVTWLMVDQGMPVQARGLLVLPPP